MKYVLSTVAAGLLLFGATANAQSPRYDERQFSEQRTQSGVFDRLRADLDRVDVTPLPFTGDHARIMKAREEVNRAESRLYEGDYSVADFDSAIAAVQQVMDQNNLLSDTNRDSLTNDVNQLKEYRDKAQHGQQ